MPGLNDINDIDITADLQGGADDASLGDAVPLNQGHDGQQVVPPGAEPAHGQQAKSVEVAPDKKPDASTSLRDQLSNAFKEGEQQPDQQQQAPAAKPDISKGEDGRYRNMDGTFASAEDIAAFEAANTPPAAQAPVADAAPAPQQFGTLLAALTPVEQQQFQSLPAEIQQFVGRTMEGLNVRAQQLNEYEFIEQQILGPRRQALEANGTTVPVALNNLFALSDFASRAPEDFVLWYAGQHNIDLDALMDEREANAVPVDPAVQQLQGTVQQLQGFMQSQQQQREQQEHEARLSEVRNFSTEKDGAGKLLRPYLTEVMNEWSAQIAAFRTANPHMPNAEVLHKAYEAACWSSPTVRAKMQQATAEAHRQEATKRVQAAKVAGASVTGAPTGSTTHSPANNNGRTLREEIEANYAAFSQ